MGFTMGVASRKRTAPKMSRSTPSKKSKNDAPAEDEFDSDAELTEADVAAMSLAQLRRALRKRNITPCAGLARMKADLKKALTALSDGDDDNADHDSNEDAIQFI